MEDLQKLTQAQAVNVLIQAARIAQSKGAFTLEDAELVSKAIKLFEAGEKTVDQESDKPDQEKAQPSQENAE
jgi:hypothetical protein